ncbi:MAG: type II secretion system protein GspL [Planctomycetota bacterium]
MVAEALAIVKEQYAAIGPLILALPSHWFLAATISDDGLLRRQRQQGMIYRLEEQLPIDAEQFTADFVESSGDAMGIALLHDRVKPILEALEAEGLTIAHVCPTGLLLHDAWRSSQVSTTGTYCLLLQSTLPHACPNNLTTTSTPPRNSISNTPAEISGGTSVGEEMWFDLLRCSEGALRDWRRIPGNSDQLCQEISAVFGGNKDAPIQTLGEDAETAVHESPQEVNPSSYTTNKVFEEAATQAHRVLLEGRTLTPDFRRGVLAGRGNWQRVAGPAQAAMIALALLLISITVINVWQAQKLTTEANEQNEAQAALFRETFPGKRVPSAILSRFRSEAARAKGMAGTDDTLPSPATTLADLEQVLQGLPENLRFRILELRIETDRLYLDGQARSHTEAEQIAARLREHVDFKLEPPRTQNITGLGFGTYSLNRNGASNRASGNSGGGVGFTLIGEREEVSP